MAALSKLFTRKASLLWPVGLLALWLVLKGKGLLETIPAITGPSYTGFVVPNEMKRWNVRFDITKGLKAWTTQTPAPLTWPAALTWKPPAPAGFISNSASALQLPWQRGNQGKWQPPAGVTISYSGITLDTLQGDPLALFSLDQLVTVAGITNLHTLGMTQNWIIITNDAQANSLLSAANKLNMPIAWVSPDKLDLMAKYPVYANINGKTLIDDTMLGYGDIRHFTFYLPKPPAAAMHVH